MTFNKEPAVIINGLSGVLQQILPLLVVVGLIQLSPEKLAGWVSIIGLVLTFVSTYLLRGQVYSESTTDKLIAEGLAAHKNSDVKKQDIEDVKDKVLGHTTTEDN